MIDKTEFLKASRLNRNAIRLTRDRDKTIEKLEQELVCSSYAGAYLLALINRIKEADIDYSLVKPNDNNIRFQLEKMGFRDDAVDRLMEASHNYQL